MGRGWYINMKTINNSLNVIPADAGIHAHYRADFFPGKPSPSSPLQVGEGARSAGEGVLCLLAASASLSGNALRRDDAGRISGLLLFGSGPKSNQKGRASNAGEAWFVRVDSFVPRPADGPPARPRPARSASCLAQSASRYSTFLRVPVMSAQHAVIPANAGIHAPAEQIHPHKNPLPRERVRGARVRVGGEYTRYHMHKSGGNHGI